MTIVRLGVAWFNMRQRCKLMLVVILSWTLCVSTLSWILLFPDAFVVAAPHNAPVVAVPHNASVVAHNASVVAVPHNASVVAHNASVVAVPHNASVVAVPHNASVVAVPSEGQQHRDEELKGIRRLAKKSPKELLCELKTRARLRTLDGSEQPFSSLGWSHLVPSIPLEQLHRRQENQVGFGSCAVVASAGAMLHSGLGAEIDSHEAVMRFNHAPTGGYERDVGTRTTFRLINEQIQYKPQFQFHTSSLYQNVTLVTWEKSSHDLNLAEWYAHGKMFGPYAERRRLHPGQPFYVLHPGYVLQLWQVIQGSTQEKITRNPPTSGFMGILVMMALCDEVHVYEYIPSTRKTALCHYFEAIYTIDCSVGGVNEWHPLRFEKGLIRQINTGSEIDLRRGRVTLPGFSTVNCDI